jgi:hypothetical protein
MKGIYVLTSSFYESQKEENVKKKDPNGTPKTLIPHKSSQQNTQNFNPPKRIPIEHPKL